MRSHQHQSKLTFNKYLLINQWPLDRQKTAYLFKEKQTYKQTKQTFFPSLFFSHLRRGFCRYPLVIKVKTASFLSFSFCWTNQSQSSKHSFTQLLWVHSPIWKEVKYLKSNLWVTWLNWPLINLTIISSFEKQRFFPQIKQQVLE